MDRWLVASLSVIAVATVAEGADRVRCDVSHPAVDVALERLRTVIATPPFSALTYDFALEPAHSSDALGPEGFDIRPDRERPGTLTVRAETPIGLARGILRVVRIGLARPSSLASARLRLRPAMPIREIYEEHGWDDPQAMDSYRERLRWMFEEGYNRLDLPFGWWMAPPGDLVDSAEFHRNWDSGLETVGRVIDCAHSLGIEVHLVDNPQFNPYFQTDEASIKEPYRSQPRPNVGVAYMLCPSDSGNWELAQRRARCLFGHVPKADGIVIYFGDPGGCPCDKCQPWGKTIIRLCREFYAPILAEVAPKWKMTATLWCVPRPDTAYVIDHLSELPAVVAGLQIPPTAPEPPYLLYDAPTIGELRRAAPRREVVMQQFLDGVGFRHGWVNLVEHPMPAMMERSLRASWRDRNLAGVYSSAFDNYYQRVGTRLIGEWGMDPSRPAREILEELGDEWFGPGMGRDFAHAMAAMERYFDVAYNQFFSDGPTEDGADARLPATEAAAAMGHVAEHAMRNPERLATFTALGEAMVLTSRQARARAAAAKLEAAGSSGQAIELLEGARADAERIAQLLSTGPYAYLPGSVFWREQWTIGKRAEDIGQQIAQIQAPGAWEPVTLPDGDFREHSWAIGSESGDERIEWVEDPQRGMLARFDNSAGAGTWSAIASPPITLNASVPFRIAFEVSRTGEGGVFWAQWITAGGDEITPHMFIDVPADGQWHSATLTGLTPPTGPGQQIRLRFVLVSPAKEALLANVAVSQKASPAPADGGD